MINFSKTKIFKSHDFDEYLKIKAYSHSFLKGEVGGVSPDFTITDAVRFGSMVDSILTEPDKADITSPIYNECKDVALYIVSFFGFQFWEQCRSQLGFTTNMEKDGLVMPFKGRLDKFSENYEMVIDLKVTNARVKDIPNLVDFMGYKNQIWGYSKPLKAKKAILIFYSRKDKKPHVHPIDVSSDDNDFFSEKILMYGK